MPARLGLDLRPATLDDVGIVADLEPARDPEDRGIARALKYETVAQAINLGFERIGTANDGANAPILHLNKEMGYRLVRQMIELHRELQT